MLKFNLENAVELLGINQAKLSALADVRPNTVADLLKSNTKRIELETLEKLLDALNVLAATKGIKKYFQIQDIIQYENDDYSNVEDYGKLINKEHFEMLRNILSKAHIQTPIKGLEWTNITMLLVLYEEKLSRGIITSTNLLSDRLLLGLNIELEEYALTNYTNVTGSFVTKLILTDKGKEFIQLLKKYGST